MRPLVRDFVIDFAESLPIAEPIVETGSRPAEGQEAIADLRALFPGREYIGCDIQEGTNVDRIEDIHALTFADDSVGTIICVETLEHVADPLRAVQEMHRVLAPGGALAISSTMFFPIHQHPWDYWRFTPEAFDLLLKPFETSLSFGHGFELMPDAVFGIGVKGPHPGLTRDVLRRTDRACADWAKGTVVDFGPIRLTLGQMWRQTLKTTVDVIAARASARRRTKDD
jgi:SAM-dependent methyltransferase